MSRPSYKGRYSVKNPSKYKGNFDKVYFRSLWEYQLMKWLDENDTIEYWSSEETVIPYTCATDGKKHRYFVDILMKSKGSPKEVLLEVKPLSQVHQPKPKAGKRKEKLLKEVLTWMKNDSKWKAAGKFAEDTNRLFWIWTEVELERVGIRLLTAGKPKWRR